MTDNKNINISTKEEPDLYQRSIKGGYWVISSQILMAFLGFIKSLFLAHIFFLNDLGIIGAAVMMMEILKTFTQTGFETALIQKKGDIQDYLDTAWTAGVIKGIVLSMVLFFSAPLLATFRIPEDKVPLAIGIFRVMSVWFLISGFRNIGAIYFSKNMDFHKTFTLSIVSTLTDIVLTVGLVLIFRSIWGVIAARLVTACVGCTGTYILSSYRPRLHFQPAKARELWKFGRWILGQNILGYFLEAGDDFFVWFYLGIPQLAIYRYAYRFANMPFQQINSVFLRVLFPGYSKIQHDLDRLRQAYYKVVRATASLATPISFLIFMMGSDFVFIFLPERMHPMTPILQILAIKLLLKSLGSTRVPFFKALGKPHLLLYLMWVRVAVIAITIYPLSKAWGIVGTAISVTLVNIIVNPIALLVMCKTFQFKVRTLLEQSLLPFCASIVMSIFLFIFKAFLFPNTTIISFLAFSITGVIIYLISLFLFDSVTPFGYRQLFAEQISMIKRALKR